MIHWPDPPFLIAGTLCGFDRDPMQGGARVVAEVDASQYDGHSAMWNIGDGWSLSLTIADAQRAAEAAIGGEA